MRGLITDRERENVLRRDALAVKGRAGMTAEELAEWLGDPMTTVGANLLPPGPYYSSSVELTYCHKAIRATATADGIYLYAISIIGEASKYANKTFTLSVDSIAIEGGAKPQIALYWHDDNGFEYAGASITEAGSVTFTTFENVNNRAYLAAYIYVTTDATVTVGASARFFGVMLEIGSERHPYVPFTEVIATNATKGAYNYSDLNRVERAVAELSDELGLGLITKTDWTMWDVPRASDMERFLQNIETIRNAEGISTALPESMNELTYSGANNIETVLLDAYILNDSSVRCGDTVCCNS